MVNTINTSTEENENNIDIPENNIEKNRLTTAQKIIKAIENKDYALRDEIEKKQIEEKQIEEKQIWEKKIEKWFSRNIKSMLYNNEENSKLSTLSKYFKNEELESKDKFNWKLEKYLPVHFNILLDHIKWEFKNIDYNSWQLSEEQINSKKENILKNTLKKYSYIMFISWEKIKLWDLINLLQWSVKLLAAFYKSNLDDVEKLDNLEEIHNKKILCENHIQEHCSEELIEYIENNNVLAKTYKAIFKENVSENSNLRLSAVLDNIWNEIEKLFKYKFKELLNNFNKWVKMDWSSAKGLVEFEVITKKILFWISSFKSLDIAFTESFYWKPTKPFFNFDINELFINLWEDEKKTLLFKDFLRLSIKEWWIEKYDDLVNNIKILKEEKAKSKVPKWFERQENTDIQNIDFYVWDKTPEIQKYELLFSKIIWKDDKLNLNEVLLLDNIDNYLVTLFSNTYWYDISVINSQINEIQYISNQDISIDKFIQNDVSNIHFLVKWWRFILKVRQIKKYNWNVIAEEIKKIPEKTYWIIEDISKDLFDAWVLDNEKITFNPGWRLNNISVKSNTEQLVWMLKWLNKWESKILNSKTQNWDFFKNLDDLYIPYENNKLKNIDNIKEKENINEWLNIGIDLSRWILKKSEIIWDKKYSKYLKKLKNYWIVTQDIENMTVKDYEIIQNFIEFLKFIKRQENDNTLLKMLEIWNKDRKNLEKEMSELLEKEEEEKHLESGFWPDKGYSRALTKLIKDYNGDFNRLWDLTRLRIVDDSLKNLKDSIVDFMITAVENENITHVSLIDKIWEPAHESKEKTWYRDMKLLFTLKDWNVVELQFHEKWMLRHKEIWRELNTSIINKMRKEKSFLSEKELRELFIIAKEKNLNLPTKENLEKILESWNIDWIIHGVWIEPKLLNKEKISWTDTYTLARNTPSNSSLKIKLQTLERILANYAWGNALNDYIKSM